MTTVNKNTQKAKAMIETYNYYQYKNDGVSLYEIYNNYSDAKEDALYYCISLKEKLNGFNSCFCGHNCMTFTYAFLFKKDNITYLAYITKHNDYIIEYD